MPEGLMGWSGLVMPDLILANALKAAGSYLLVILGFSLVVFVHELGHFLAAKSCGVRVNRFAVGFGRALFSFRKGIGLRRGSTEDEYRERLAARVEERRKRDLEFKEKTGATESELAEAARELGLSETEYRFNWLPLGGYVKMQGQEDFEIDKSGEIALKDDPGSFLNKPVGQRMIIVSSGVVMNVVFAALVFMLVYMIGKDSVPAIVGATLPDWPADRVGLLPGDRIVEFDGERIADFDDLKMATVLAKPGGTMSLVFERPDAEGGPPSRHSVTIQPAMDDDLGFFALGVQAPGNNIIATVGTDAKLPAEDQLKEGDVVIEAGGRKIETSYDIKAAVIRERGRYATLKVRRTLADGSSVVREVKCRAYHQLLPSGDKEPEPPNLLGLVPAVRVGEMDPNGRAALAGLKPGDLILEWDQQAMPTAAEIRESVAGGGERDIRVEVLRRPEGEAGQGRRLQFVVRPKAGAFGRGKPNIQMDMVQETELPVVSKIAMLAAKGIQTPASRLKDMMDRGSLLLKVNEAEVATWSDLIDRFFELAGSDVTLTWRAPDGQIRSGTIRVPATLGTVVDIPPDHVIVTINGKRTAEMEVNGQYLQVPVRLWIGASKVLQDCIGQTVDVQIRGPHERQAKTTRVEVTPEMADTWPLRIVYDRPDLLPEMMREKIQETNPFKAMMIGVRKTYYFIEQVYLIIQRMVVERTVGFEHVSGPVGIVQMGSQIARHDFVDLLYFLALISANLAVINFLPLPIFDGGLMVFLLVEKVKGGPIPLKVQVVTQLVGLALIITIFLYVTLQDFQRIFG